MKKLFKPKIIVSLFLLVTIIAVSLPVNAEPAAGHRQVIEQFIFEIRQIQRQVYDIAQFALNNDPLFAEVLTANINYINGRIEALNRRILEYLETVPSISDENIHVLLVQNALNLVKNSLFSLNMLTITATAVERIGLLDEYFRARTGAIDTLNTVEEIIVRF